MSQSFHKMTENIYLLFNGCFQPSDGEPIILTDKSVFLPTSTLSSFFGWSFIFSPLAAD